MSLPFNNGKFNIPDAEEIYMFGEMEFNILSTSIKDVITENYRMQGKGEMVSSAASVSEIIKEKHTTEAAIGMVVTQSSMEFDIKGEHTRKRLHRILCNILGTKKVYFQPPENIKIEFPCIIYHRINLDRKFANNKTYFTKRKYQVKYIDKDPEVDEIINELLTLPFCAFDRSYTADNLNHIVFSLYF